MPRPALRSRSLRRLKKRLPGGRRTVSYERSKPGKGKCAVCKKPLSGMARERPSKLGKLAKSKRKPNRPYGGSLCPKCARETIKAKVLKI